MQYENPFDTAMGIRKLRDDVRISATDVADTLDLAWLATKSVFGDAATPEVAVQVAALMLERIPHAKR